MCIYSLMLFLLGFSLQFFSVNLTNHCEVIVRRWFWCMCMMLVDKRSRLFETFGKVLFNVTSHHFQPKETQAKASGV